MKCHLEPTRGNQALCIACADELTANEVESVSGEKRTAWAVEQNERVVVDVRRVESMPTALELFEFSENLCLELPRNVRLAFVVRRVQAGWARVIENIARNRGLSAGIFFDAEDAATWVSQANGLIQGKGK